MNTNSRGFGGIFAFFQQKIVTKHKFLISNKVEYGDFDKLISCEN